MNNNILEYKELLKDLWIKLENHEISTGQYHQIKEKWLINNADEELFDYFIELYKGRPIEKEYINYKKKSSL